MDMLDDTVALRAFVNVGLFAQFMRVNSDGFRFGTADGAVRAFALGCLHIASLRIGREHQALSSNRNRTVAAVLPARQMVLDIIGDLCGNKGQYQVLVTDIGLGGRFDGWEIARRAREINPDFPVVYMSGKYAEDWASKGVPNSIMLAKPFAPAQLVTAVSQFLNAGLPTAPTE